MSIRRNIILSIILISLLKILFISNYSENVKYYKKLLIELKSKNLKSFNLNLIYNSLSDMEEFIESNMNSTSSEKIFNPFFISQMKERFE
jgi:hypothetical protein